VQERKSALLSARSTARLVLLADVMMKSSSLVVLLAGCSASTSSSSSPPPDAMPSPSHVIDITQKTSSTNLGDVHGLTVSTDQTRAYIGEGAQITILDLTNILPPDATPLPHPSVIAKVPMDSQMLAMVRNDDGGDLKLFVAGGVLGLLAMDAREPVTACAPSDLGVTDGCFKVTTIDDQDRSAHAGMPSDKYCWDVDVAHVGGTGYIVAVFGALENPTAGGSELRVYDRATGAFVRSVPIISGVATSMSYALAVSGSHVYIAMGTGGVMHIDLTNVVSGGAASFDQQLLDPANPPAACAAPALAVTPAETARVRDVAVAGRSVWVAADTFGLVQLDATTLDVTACEPLLAPTPGRDPSYGLGVQAVEIASTTYVAVFGGGCAKFLEGGAPYSTLGRMTYDLGVGGDAGGCAVGIEAQFLFAASSAGLALRSYTAGFGLGGGNLVAREASPTTVRVYNQPVAYDVPSIGGTNPGVYAYTYAVAAGSPPPTSPDFVYVGHGLDAFGAFSLLGNPNLIVPFFEGSSGSVVTGEYIDLAIPSAPDLIPPAAGDPRPNSVLVDNAQWLEPTDTGHEWFTSSYNYGIALDRTTLGSTCQVESYSLATPSDGECTTPRVYFSATSYDDPSDASARLVTTRSTSRYGAVVYDRNTLVERASTTASGCQLYQNGDCNTPDVCSPSTYAYQIDTHPELATWSAAQHHISDVRATYTWSAKTFSYPVGGVQHQIAAIAAGFDANNTDEVINATGMPGQDGIADDPNFSKPALVLVDLDAAPTPQPGCATRCGNTQIPVVEPIATAYGTGTKGNAFSLDLVDACNRKHAFVADFGGRILAFDITDPFHPELENEWTAPFSVLDGYIDNVIDLVADYDPAWGEAVLYVSAFRPGLSAIHVGVDCSATHPFTFPSEDWFDPRITRARVPGLSHLLRRYQSGDKRGLILGDKNGGVRFYGEFEDAAAQTCQ
jgi:hypothetical protein